jgi:hypothetical protein
LEREKRLVLVEMAQPDGPPRRNGGRQLEPLVTEPSAAAGSSKLELIQRTIMGPFSHRKNDSTRILADRKFFA